MRLSRVSVWALVLACNGTIHPAGEHDSPDGPDGPGPEGPVTLACDICTDAPIALGTQRLRRLSNSEFDKTVRDVLPMLAPRTLTMLEDSTRHGFENDSSLLGPDPLRVEQYEFIAIELATEVAADMNAHLDCDPSSNERACIEQSLRSLGRDIFRRPMSDDEAARYMGLFDAVRADVELEGAFQLLVQALLQSPQFLYRIELGDRALEAPEGTVALGSYEIATRLSYFLWGSMPDEELFAAAEADALRTPEEREIQARRMLADPRARELVVNFHRQWFELDEVLEQNKDSDLFPAWSEALRGAIREESDRFVEHVVFEGEGNFNALLSSNVSFVNDELASLYGVASGGSGWNQVELDPNERAGLLTRANFLATRAKPENGSPPLRGAYLLERVACATLLPPPDDADTSPVELRDGENATNRELFEDRTAPAQCQSCHEAIDGFGFAFEAYDATGAFRTEERGLPVDSTGWISGTDVDGPVDDAVELSNRLAESDQVRECMTMHWFEFAEGRVATPEDNCRLCALHQQVREANGDVREMMVSLVTAPEFVLLAESALAEGEGR